MVVQKTGCRCRVDARGGGPYYHSKICINVVVTEIKTFRPTLSEVHIGEGNECVRDSSTGANFTLLICAHCRKWYKIDVDTRPWVFGEGRSLEGDKFTC